MGTTGDRSFDAVVVGAGAYGASVAFHLAARGRRVALVDRRPFVTETSPRAAGLAVQVRSLLEFGQLAKRSVELLAAFGDLTGEALEIHQTGSVAIARDDASEARVRRHPELGARYGLEVLAIDAAEAAQLAPWADYRTARAISYTPTDLHLEPGELPRAYIRAAARRGLVALDDHHVTSVIVEDGAVTGVATDRGTLRASTVVNCAGGWIAALAGTAAGRPLPVEPVRHQLIVTEPLAEVADHHASFRVVDANVYARPCWGGLMFGGYESAPLFLDAGALPSSVTALPLDDAAIAELRDRVPVELPLLRTARVRELRGGIPTLTADGHPIVDELPDARGCYVVGGCNVGGLSTSPAVGEALAEWIASGTRPAVLAPFALARFATRSPEALARDAREKYSATEYG
jgi:glycine/D-amino acid oxidase-like deaminating enzyme